MSDPRSSPRRLVLNMRDSRPLWRMPDWAVDEIRDAAAGALDVEVVEAEADGRGDGGAISAEALEAIRGAEIHVGFGFPRALFDAAAASGGALRWVHSGSAGVGGALYPEMVASPVLLTNSAGIHADPIAETVLAMVLHFARGLDFAVEGQRRREWVKEPFGRFPPIVREASGLTLGIVGYGGIGRAVGLRAAALGMRVLAYRRRPMPVDPPVRLVEGPAGLDELLRESHFLLLALPRTAATERFLDASRIGALRPDAVVINVGRGELIDEGALVEALRDDRIRGAALDVFETEPLPTDSPFWTLPNVLVTPHVSGTTDRFWRRQTDLITANLRRYRAGEPLLNLVDKAAGY
jgi:phosphoglycerate dehydrogenase-like enzyme